MLRSLRGQLTPREGAGQLPTLLLDQGQPPGTSPLPASKRAEQPLERAASHYRDGEATGFENLAKYVTSELAYTVEMERCQAKVEGRDAVTPIAVRVTTIFRPEDGTWKVVHRHADPITTAQPAESVIQD